MADTYNNSHKNSLFVSWQSRQSKLIWQWFLLPIGVIWSLIIWNVSVAKSEEAQTDKNGNPNSELHQPVTSFPNLANLSQKPQEITETQPFIAVQIDNNSHSSFQLTQQAIAFASFNKSGTIINSNIETFVSGLPYQFEPKPILIAAPENFNPLLQLPPPPPPPSPPPPPVTSTEEPGAPALVLERIQPDFRDDYSKFYQHNRIFEPVFTFKMPNGEKITFKTGFNTFEQPKVDTVTNIPLQFGWQGKTGQYNIKAAAGIDIFNRLPMAFNFAGQIDRPIFVKLTDDYKLKSALFLSFVLEHGPYKTSAATLESGISSWRSGLNAYWQIDPNTSFFTLYRFGLFNDGNFEQQVFSRLEHKFGQFWTAANLFGWAFTSDQQEASGYFSPGSFLVMNLEVGWEGDIFSFLRCRGSTTLGRQILNGSMTGGNSYQTRCTVKLSPIIDFDFGYGFSNVRNLDTGDSPYNNRNLNGQFRMKF
ncbi:hypothetical protein NIES2107_00270 [Nostoc carneum NIES-2107]|nr:hypothetical protein NIES2107_00270 [Nostoc carneum NIES-2107]